MICIQSPSSSTHARHIVNTRQPHRPSTPAASSKHASRIVRKSSHHATARPYRACLLAALSGLWKLLAYARRLFALSPTPQLSHERPSARPFLRGAVPPVTPRRRVARVEVNLYLTVRPVAAAKSRAGSHPPYAAYGSSPKRQQR